MANKEHHVVPDPKGGWRIERNDARRASYHFASKDKAVERARVISKNARTELVIHDKDGKIAQKDSHGKDPKGSKG